MTMMTASEARAEWAQVLRQARSGEPVTVTQHGEPVAVVVDVVWWRRAAGALEAGSVQVPEVEVSDDASWVRRAARLRAEVLHDLRAELVSRPTLDRIAGLSSAGYGPPDQVISAGLDHLVRAERRRVLRSESQAGLVDEADVAEAGAIQAEMGELRAW